VSTGPTVAILLAAGLSSRMGVPKALLPWEGRPLVRYQVEQLLAGGCDRVIVVTGHERAAIEDALAGGAAEVAYNPDYAAGRAGSVRVGANAAPADAGRLVILNVDQPRAAAVIRRLLDAHRIGGATLTVPAHAGRRGHPLVLDGSLRTELLAVEEASEGLKAVVRRHQGERQELEFESDEVLLDLNTPESYAAAQRST
jgi:molybdenum cofactor cytidylyltransferase